MKVLGGDVWFGRHHNTQYETRIKEKERDVRCVHEPRQKKGKKRKKRSAGGKLSMGAIRTDDKKNTRRVVLLSVSPTTNTRAHNITGTQTVHQISERARIMSKTETFTRFIPSMDHLRYGPPHTRIPNIKHQSVVRAIRQCKGLERLVGMEQTPETLHTRELLCLPRDIGKLEEEVFGTLGIGRAHKVVEEYLKVRFRRVRRAVGLLRGGRGVRRPARLSDVHLWLVRERVGYIHVGFLEEGERPVCRVLDGRRSKPRVHVGHTEQK